MEMMLKVKFSYPYGPALSFNWPFKKDICFGPVCNIIITYVTPLPRKGSGRMYYFSENDVNSRASKKNPNIVTNNYG